LLVEQHTHISHSHSLNHTYTYTYTYTYNHTHTTTLTHPQVDALLQFGKVEFDVGKYEDAAIHLAQYMLISKDEEKSFQV
jgi:triacylglycerol esterase/lipase EstA (alpha/beta hydrolase family)